MYSVLTPLHLLAEFSYTPGVSTSLAWLFVQEGNLAQAGTSGFDFCQAPQDAKPVSVLF